MPHPVAVPIVLTDAEREQLQVWAHTPTGARALALRSRIVLACADAAGQPNSAISETFGISRATVTKWRNRFAADRLGGLLDGSRPGRPRTIADADVQRVITTTLGTPPKDATRWSTRSLAVEVGLSQTVVSRIWRAFGLQPHRPDAAKRSDPQSIDEFRSVPVLPGATGPLGCGP
jgi:transposase